MPKLLDLPNEILDQIFDNTIPESVEAFAESSMHISSLAQDRLYQSFNDLSYYCLVEPKNWVDAVPGKHSPLELLKDILQKPYLVRYPQQLTLGQFEESTTKEPTHSDEFRSQVIKALVGCRYVPSDEIENWATEICCGNYDAGTALLLALLSNVRCLVIRGNSSHRILCEAHGLLHHRSFTRHTIKCAMSTLGRVAKVHISGSSYARGMQGLRILAQLSALPSVDVLRCSGTLCLGNAMKDWSRHGYDGGVTKIETLDSRIHPDIVNHLLQGV